MQLALKHTYRESAFVLRTQKLGDSDKIVILLCEKYGLVHAVAKSARKHKSKFGARLEPFMLLDISFVYKESLSILNQALTQKAYAMPLMGNYRAYLVGSLLNELTEKFVRFGEYDSYYFRLLHGAVSALSRGNYSPVDVANAFILRLLDYSGWSFQICTLDSCYSATDLILAERYCHALLDSQWAIIAEEDFGKLPLGIFSEVTKHIQSVADIELLTLPLLQKELFSGR